MTSWRGNVTMFFQGPKLRSMLSTTCMTPGRERPFTPNDLHHLHDPGSEVSEGAS